jgi:O-acetyl-ADP-ribose deacetylase (regulator of RNase III)
MFWRASERSLRESVMNAMRIVNDEGFASVAFPVIGAGSGSFNRDQALEIMLAEFGKIETRADIVVVEYVRKA